MLSLVVLTVDIVISWLLAWVIRVMPIALHLLLLGLLLLRLLIQSIRLILVIMVVAILAAAIMVVVVTAVATLAHLLRLPILLIQAILMLQLAVTWRLLVIVLLTPHMRPQTELFPPLTAWVIRSMVLAIKSTALATRLMTWVTRSRANLIQRARGRALAMLMVLVMRLATRLPI